MSATCSREVSSPTAQPFQREPPPPGFACPGHVAPSHFLRASTRCSRADLPGISQPGALSGFPLQSLTEQRSPGLSTGHPLLRLACPPAFTTLDLTFVAAHLPGPGLAPRLSAAGSAGNRTRASLSVHAQRFRIIDSPSRPAARGPYGPHGLASGVSSLCRLERTLPHLCGLASPRLSWVSSSLGPSPSRPRTSKADGFVRTPFGVVLHRQLLRLSFPCRQVPRVASFGSPLLPFG